LRLGVEDVIVAAVVHEALDAVLAALRTYVPAPPGVPENCEAIVVPAVTPIAATVSPT
jgi:hypothetical protein